MSDLHLARHSSSSPLPGPVGVIVMDGVGLGRRDRGDALHLARTPVLDALMARPFPRLQAHGLAVGMPSDGDMGNSEVGHNVLGSGRVFDQGAKLVDGAVRSGRVFDGETWRWLVEAAVREGKALHFIGLLSDGNVHSHHEHLHAMLRRAAQDGCRKLYVHPLLDGRDVPPTSALDYVAPLEAVLAELRESFADGDFRVASGGGRMVTTMDRYEADWSIVQRGWQAHVLGEGARYASLEQAIRGIRDEQPGISDQFLPEFVIVDSAGPVGPVQDGDGVVFFNFRGDRALEITRAFSEGDSFAGFDRRRVPQVRFAGMMQYDGDLNLPARYLVDPPVIDRPMSEYLVAAGVRQLAVAETQKFGHVTYFWNGNRGLPFDRELEEWIEVPSDRVPFEQRPWMKVAEVTDVVLASLRRPEAPHLIRVNYANGDMVGHTGDLEATIVAIQALDLSLRRLIQGFEEAGGALLITADHGNADQMFGVDKKSGEYTDSPFTAHTLNRVPALLVDPVGGRQLVIRDHGIANVAATAFELLGFEAPEGYAPSLLAR